MRNPRWPGWARCSGQAAALISAAMAFASSARAQDVLACGRPTDLPPVQVLVRNVTATLTSLPASTDVGTVRDPAAVPNATDRRAEVCANREQAPQTIAALPGVVVVATSGFTGAILGRLDGARGQGAAADPSGADGMMGLGRGEKSRPPASPFTVYATGTLLGGSRSDMPNLVGFGYDGASGTLGIEYAVNRNLIVGVAGNYTATDANLHSGATTDVSSIQLAGYLSYATKQWFVDGLAALGGQDVDMVRPGLATPIRASTSGTVMALAARAGYLFEFGSVRAGPLAGLTYVRSRIDGYTETGDPNLTFTISSQTLDSLASSLGIRFLAPFQAGEGLIVPYLNITWEHQFGDSSRILSANLAQVPALPPILAAVPSFDARDFGKIEGGITVQLGSDLSASVSGATTFARDEGNDYRISAGLNFRF